MLSSIINTLTAPKETFQKICEYYSPKEALAAIDNHDLSSNIIHGTFWSNRRPSMGSDSAKFK